MESCLLDPVKNEVQSFVNQVKNEAQYLCCFNSYVEKFEQKKNILAAKHKDVKRKFQKGKGVFYSKFEALQWEREVDDIIHIDTKIKKKLFFGWCTNCWSQYRRGKELAEKNKHIEKLLERCNSNIVAGRANVLDIKYLSSQGFIHFDSRESQFQDLLKKLQDENCNMIGLQGLGGTGKTLMAKEVGHKLKEAKLIDKFIFLVVSQPPDFNKIRGELATCLDLNFDEVKEEELSSTILSRITNMDQKLLIILDDVWEEFDLTEKLGIPFGHQHKECTLLITTRNSHVCTEMGCQSIQLQILTNKEALNLFQAHASLSNSYRGFKGMPQKIVKHCGGVPVAIVALARSLKNQPISVWKDALKTLEYRDLDQNLEEAYKCLKLRYDNLSQKAKELLLISSLFPEDFEIPIEILIGTGIGLGSFNENDKYHLIRSEVHGAIMELIDSSLLLNDKEECVKMHDLVREVALWIGENDIQSLLDWEKPIKGNLRYIFWKADKFPDEIDGNKLEYLSIFLDDSEGFNVTDSFFKEMTSIKVLILANVGRGPALSLTNSLQPLKSVQTLILRSMELGDISILGNLLTLMTLWFYNCSIVELPKEFLKLKKLSSLEVEECKIKRNNPFEVIEMCSQLEELTFVGNECDDEAKYAISHNGSPLTLHRYCISSEDDLSYYSEKYGLSRCFRADELSNLVSHATFKQLVERAEVLLWKGEDGRQRMWKNLVPDIVPIDKECVMNDLIVLHLSLCPNIECLVDTKDHGPIMSAFCNLAELHLSEMGLEDLCRGPPPFGFLEQLEILKLTKCYELKSIVFNANYNLCHLKSMKLEDCPKLMSVFQPSTASSLKELEELTIKNCEALEYIVAGEDGDTNQKSYYDSLFPSLKELTLCGVPSFIGIVREYHQLMSSSMHKQSPPLSRHNSRNLNQSLATRAFFWVQACCSLNKLRPANKETDIMIFEDRSFDHTNPLNFDASIDRGAPSLTAQSLLLQSLKNVREITLFGCHEVISLSPLSIATSTIALETLTILRCRKLKCITTHEGDYQVGWNICSIFPTLEKLEIESCEELEFLFVSAMSVVLQKLKSLTIQHVPKLKCVFGNFQNEQHSSNQNQNDELYFDLPALETLDIRYASRINIFAKNYCMVNWTATENFDASIDRGAPSLTAQSLLLQSLKNVREITLFGCHEVISLSPLFIATSTIALETLTILRCRKLKCITTHEGDYQVDRNNCSIFPTLEKLEIENCGELEFLFVSTISVGLQKLKSLTVQHVPKLKCVIGNYQNDELHFDLPALETLCIYDAPKMNWTAIEEVHASTIGAPLFHVTQNLLKNIREIELVECTNLISLTTVSIASIVLLEVLIIRACDRLKCIVGDEEDARTQINYNCIFPKLKRLEVSYCDALEYLFPAYAFRSLVYLESLKINTAPMLKYIFGRSQHDDSLNLENQNVQTLIDCPALKDLFIWCVPKLVSICHENYYMRGLYLRSIILKEHLEFIMRPFNEFLVCWHTEQQETKVIEMCWKTLESLQVCDFKIQEIFDLQCMETKKKGDELQPLTSNLQSLKLLNLSELLNICVGPKCIIRFDSLRVLTIKACKKIRVIFSASTVRSLPVLEDLYISECEELVHIVEDYETNADDHVHHEPCFPNLKRVSISHCHKLKYLFSVTISDILPKLFHLRIFSAYELEHVLIKQDEMKEMFMKNVLPKRCRLQLINLPNLISVCHGINFQKEDCSTEVFDCPKFDTSTTQDQADPQTRNSQVEEKLKEKLKERLSSHMGEEITQQSFTKAIQDATKEIVEEDFMSEIVKMTISSSDSKLTGRLVVEERAKGVSSNTSYPISLTSEKEAPIHTSLSLTALPTRDNTHAFAKIFEEEEEGQGCLITPRRFRSGIKASNSLSEDKLETSTDGDPFAPPVTTILSEQTSQAILSSKVSTSVNQAASSILLRASDDDTIEVYDKSHPHSTILFEGVDHGDIKEAIRVQNEYKLNVEPSSLTQREQESSYSKDQLTDSQPRSAMSTTPFVTISQDEYSEGGIQIVEVRGEEGALVLETPRSSSLTSKESDKELNPSVVNKTDSLKASSNDELAGKVARNERIMIDPQQSTVGAQNFTKDELVGKEVPKGSIMMEPQSQQETTGHDIHFQEEEEEEEEREDDVQLPNKSKSLAIDSSGSGNLVPNITHPINSLEGVNNEGINEASVVQNESKTNVTCHGDQANPGNITQIEQETSYSRGRMVGSRDCVESDFIEHTKLSVSPFYTAIEMMPSFLEANNEASIVPGVQEIIHMMKLEGFESLIFAKALKTRPQLQLSRKDRSARVLCMSYRVLLDILNILTTKTPFTITEADKRLLAEHLKDAYLLGFDEDWIESTKTKVFDSGIYEVDSIQKVLKGLDNDLKSNEAILGAIRDEEVEAARVVEVAQQEHANVMSRHAHLLKERQYIITRKHQCWEIIAAKNRQFGF